MTPPSVAAQPCAKHPQNEATFTCVRCGAFACPACESTLEAELCDACEARRTQQVGQGLSAGALFTGSFGVVGRHAQLVFTFAAAQAATAMVIGLVGSLHWSLTLLAVVASLAVSTTFTAAWIVVIARAARGEAVEFGRALREAADYWWPMFAITLLAGLGVGLGMLLLVVPGVILALGWCLAPAEAVLGRHDVFDAFSGSWSKTSGHRGDLFLAYVGVGLVCLLTGAAVAGSITFAGTMLHVPKVALEAVNNLVGDVVVAPVVALPVLAWLRLSAQQGA